MRVGEFSSVGVFFFLAREDGGGGREGKDFHVLLVQVNAVKKKKKKNARLFGVKAGMRVKIFRHPSRGFNAPIFSFFLVSFFLRLCVVPFR